jgi:hypothetical protein
MVLNQIDMQVNFFKRARVNDDDVIGVAKCPTNGSSLYGLIKLAINLI